MQSNPNPRVIEELKEAGEELKEVFPPKLPKKEEKPHPVEKTAGGISSLKVKGEKREWSKKMGEYQKELSQEQAVVEKTYQEIKELEKKLEVRRELLKRLKNKSQEINKEVGEFEEELALAKKENSHLLARIKSSLCQQSEPIR